MPRRIAVYWRRHMREPVRFADGVKALHDDGFRIFLEVGPHPTLLALAQQSLPQDGNLFLTSMRRGKEDWNELVTSLADLHVHGVPVDFAGFDRPYHRRRVALPTYPFDRERYWAPPLPHPGQRGAEDVSATVEGTDELFYKIAWEPPASSRPKLRTPSELEEGTLDRFEELAAQHDFAVYDRSRPEFDRLTAHFTCKALIDLGFDATPGRCFNARAEMSRLRIAERYSRLFEALIAILAQQGVLAGDGDDYVVTSLPMGDPVGRSNELLGGLKEVSAELEIIAEVRRRTLPCAGRRRRSAETTVRWVWFRACAKALCGIALLADLQQHACRSASPCSVVGRQPTASHTRSRGWNRRNDALSPSSNGCGRGLHVHRYFTVVPFSGQGQL